MNSFCYSSYCLLICHVCICNAHKSSIENGRSIILYKGPPSEQYFPQEGEISGLNLKEENKGIVKGHSIILFQYGFVVSIYISASILLSEGSLRSDLYVFVIQQS